MKTRFPECEEKTTAPIIKFEENKVTLYFQNPNRRESVKIEVDGCIYNDSSAEIRCDYLLLDFNHREHFIELKGSDVPHAIKQLEASINALSESPRDLLKMGCCSNSTALFHHEGREEHEGKNTLLVF